MRLSTDAEIALYVENAKLYLSKVMMAKFENGRIYDPLVEEQGRVYPISGYLLSSCGYTPQTPYTMKCLKGKTIWYIVPKNGMVGKGEYLRSIRSGGTVSILQIYQGEDMDNLSLQFLYYAEKRPVLIIVRVSDQRWLRDLPEMEKLLQTIQGAKKDLEAVGGLDGDEVRTLSTEGIFGDISYHTKDLMAFSRGDEAYLSLFPKEREKTVAPSDIPADILDNCDGIFGFEIVGLRVWKDGLTDEEVAANREIRKVQKRHFGENIWIPYAPKDRAKQFKRFFDDKDEMYQYMKYISEQGDGKEDYYYTLSDFGIKEERSQ